jgi:phospholipid/cholesterol/gamma-HCH transport system substrate-binding protein
MATNRPVLLQIKGIALLTCIALLIALAVAVFDKRFTDSVRVTVVTERSGLQLNANGDVRMRGALIGRIAAVEHDGENAVIRVELDPDQAQHVPADARARILPTTLFGQKFLELVAPRHPSDQTIQAGAVIPMDRTSQAVELARVLDELGPLLTAVRPQDLSTTLQALADGLEGRGEQLGTTAVAAGRLLNQFNRRLPLLVRDLALLGSVAHSYARIAPDLFRLLDNVTVTASTIVDRRRALRRFAASVTEFAVQARGFLDTNGDGLVEVTQLTAPVLRLLARYSPALPCLLEGLTIAEQRLNDTFSDEKFQLTVLLGLNYPGYTQDDLPETTVDTGPDCAELPTVDGTLQIPQFADGANWEPGSTLPLRNGGTNR